MIADIPKITQRSIIAYSAVNGTPLPGDWYTAAVRRNFGVDSLTTPTLRIIAPGGGRVTVHGFAANCRAVVSGSTVGIECRFTSTDSPGVSYGVSGHGTLTLEVATAGDAERGIAGATEQFAIDVLVLDRDWPYASPTFLSFRVGETVNTVLSATKHARGNWYTSAVNTGYGIGASGGQKIVGNVEVNGDYADSGLILHHEDGNMWISGTAARPGVYRVYFDLLSTVQGFGEGGQVYHPFEGGPGQNPLIIWIYRDWLPGDLVVVCPELPDRPGKYTLKVVHAPSWSGLGDELPNVNFTRTEENAVVRWRGSRICRTNGEVSQAYHYAVQNTSGWALYGAATDSDTPPAIADMTLLAAAEARGFDDEVPPKQGWKRNGAAVDLIVTGDERWFVPSPAENSGWYDYAGTITLPVTGSEPVTVEVCERERHHIPQYAGWNLGGTTENGARYLVNIAGAWRITAELSDFSDCSDLAAAPTAEPVDAHANAAVPFCPAKPDDLGLPIGISDGAAIMQSLNNRYDDSGSLALLMDGFAGVMWKRYPLRRLLSLFKVGATVTIHLSAGTTTTEYSETHNPTGESPEHDNSGDYSDGIPSVPQVEDAGGAITVSKSENWEKEQLEISTNASADVTFALSYALWSDNFPKYLEALVNRSTHYSGSTASYSHDRAVSGKSGGESKTYGVESISRSEAIARGIPFPGDGQGEPSSWTIAGGSARYSWRYWDSTIQEWYGEEYVDFTYNPATGTWSSTSNSDWLETAFVPSVSINPATGVLDVTMSEIINNEVRRSISGTGVPAAGGTTVTASAGNTWTYDYEEWGDREVETVTISATGQASGSGDSPGATGPHAGVPDGDMVKVVYVSAETLGATERKTVGPPSTAGGHNFAAHGTASLFFGEGRESNWPHRAIVAAAGGEGGISVDFSTTDSQRQVETKITRGGYRHRSGGADDWSYYVDGRQTGDPETWGTTVNATAVDAELPETLSDNLSHGATFNTGAVQLLFAYAMGSLSATVSSTAGSASGSAFGYRQSPVGDEESADIPEVSGSWSRSSATASGGPEYDSSYGDDVSGSVDLSDEISGDEWEQWGYRYEIHTTTRSGSIRIEITDSDFPAPVQSGD